MEKIRVIVEYLNNEGDYVTVYDYDSFNSEGSGEIETCPKPEAYEKYNVLGELINGDIITENEDYEDDYEDFCQYMNNYDDDEV